MEETDFAEERSSTLESNNAITGNPEKYMAVEVLEVASTSAIDQAAPSNAASEEETNYPTGTKFWLLMFNLGAVIALYALDMSIVATAVPRITDHFHTTADVGWYSVAFRLGQCAFQFLYGKAYKLFPIKRVFLLANAFSFLGSIICATAISSPMLVLGRAIAGVGAAGLSAGGNQMLVLSTPLQIRSKFLGMWSAIEGVTTIAGPLIGGAITDTIGWRWCFWINVPIGGATLLLTFLCFSETPKTGEVARLTFKEKIMQLDFVSTFLILPALTCLFLAFSWGGTTYPWSDGHVVGLIVTFAVLAAAFVYEQIRKGDKATIPIHILKRRNVIACVLFGMFQNSAGNTFEYYLPIYYQAARGYSPLESGYLMFPILVGATIAAVGTGFGISASGYYAPFMMFTSTAMTVAAGVVATFNTETGLAKLILITGLFGAGYGAGAPGPFIAVQAVLPQDEVPLGMAVLLFVYGFGPAVFITVAQVILSSQLTKNIHGLLPGLDSASIDAVGLTELVSKVPRAEWHEIYAAVSKSVVHTWYLVIVLAACTFLGSLMVEWRSIKNNADKTVEPTNQDMELAGASKEEKQSFEQK